MTDTNNTPEPETVTLRGELKVSTFSHGYTIGVEHDGGYTDLYDWLDSRYIVTGDGVQVEIRPLSNDKPESPDSAKNKTDITDQNEPEIERQNLSITEGPECERCGEPNCERCDRCGALVHASCPTYWYAENEFWNTIYGSSDNPCGDGIIRCIACFTNDCADAGHPICWVPRAIGSEPVLPDPHDSIDAKYGPPPEGYEYTGAVRSAAYGDWYLDPCVGPSFWPAGLYDSEVAYPILRRKDSSPEQFRALRPIAHGRTHGMYDPVEPNTAPTADPSLDQFRKLGDSTPATSSPVESEGFEYKVGHQINVAAPGSPPNYYTLETAWDVNVANGVYREVWNAALQHIDGLREAEIEKLRAEIRYLNHPGYERTVLEGELESVTDRATGEKWWELDGAALDVLMERLTQFGTACSREQNRGRHSRVRITFDREVKPPPALTCQRFGCERHPDKGDAIHRTSPKGEPFKGLCDEHMGDTDPVVDQIADALAETEVRSDA